ncbi:hypothetical protein BFP77_10285 [Maribacter sp. 4U21]|uniref:hypothetical protein n=1 Tax=Maribacter sp. 4U21 TaxID=1889779 RepID=UPI000C14F17E|nr:hypothetical protein [Maribacter sp. 4U21]PIB28031.1 hypothetical protein BFP77_10285 [Maribacter sp. 4U21]
MQKLELRNNLNEIIKRLMSRELVAFLDNNNIEKSNLLKLVVDSKGGFDQAATDPEKEKVFEQFEAVKMYETAYFSRLISMISTAQNSNRSTYVSNTTLNDFYSFHKSLISTFNLIDNLLMNSKEIFNEENDFVIEDAQNKGNLILQIVDEGNVPLEKFQDIISSLENLIEKIYYLYDKVEGEKFDIHPSISMVDSGSDINLILKIPKKAANLIAQILKEFWDIIANNKSYRHGQKLKGIEKSLTVLEKIKVAKDGGIIDAETAKVISNGIIENTETIILKNTMTKQIMLERKDYSNRQLLLDQNKRFLLENPKKENKEENDEQ